MKNSLELLTGLGVVTLGAYLASGSVLVTAGVTLATLGAVTAAVAMIERSMERMLSDCFDGSLGFLHGLAETTRAATERMEAAARQEGRSSAEVVELRTEDSRRG